jgi:hypothetical protein
MKKAILLFLAILCCSLFFPGCGSSSSTPTTGASIVSIKIVSAGGNTWDSKRGMEFYLAPQDLQHKIVATSGTLEVKLFLSELLRPNWKGEQLQQWSNVKVAPGDFDAAKGALIRLEYSNFTPDVVHPGILEVTLLTKDGKKFFNSAQVNP